MRSPAHDDGIELIQLEPGMTFEPIPIRRVDAQPPIDAPFGWFGAVIMSIAIIFAICLLQDRDARIEKAARAEDAARSRAIQQLLATCPATDKNAVTVIAFFDIRDGVAQFDHCVPLRARSSYSPATRSVIKLTER